MAEETRKSLDEIVRLAQSLAPEDRAAFVREACAADEALFDSVTREIANSADSWADLHSNPDLDLTQEPADLEGELVGPYRVVRTLGEGGMGAVFLAERADGQFQQQVAIKVVRRGLLSKHVQNRLRIERQILATLDHPNIAKLLDGGSTPDGTPYIVMEYIDGDPIDVYCDQHSLTLEERLRLFRTICSAVHSAHQNLIVHRDLKPSNILVTRNGIPKLLDFGIAKLLDERQLMQTLAVTQADVRLMTPDHASPEQVRGDPITTASDVYVLAILLYELLTGLKPFARMTRLADLERAICEEPPTAPSAALVTSAKVPESQLDELALRRRTTLQKLRRQLRGDLDKIVLMGLRKEPERRYSSVEQFAADIERFLHGLPVAAQADAWTYRTTKFVRRHFIVVGMSAAFVLSLIGFSITTYLQSIRIEEERDIAAYQRSVAEVQRVRAEDVSSFMTELFQLSDPSEARGNEVRVREILDRGAARIRNELKEQPELQATLMDTMGKVYLNLGLNNQAAPLFDESLTVRRRLFGNEHDSVAQSLTSLAWLQRNNGNLEEALKLTQEALDISRTLHGNDSVESALQLQNLGILHYLGGKSDQAEPLLRESLALYVKHEGKDSEKSTTVLDMLGRIAQSRGNIEEAEQLLTRALEIQRKSSGADHPLTIERLHNLATIMQSKGDLATAERQFREVVELCERVLEPSHQLTADALGNLGYTLQSLGRLEEAEQYYQQSLELNQRWRGEGHYRVGYDLASLGMLEFERKRFPQAQARLREGLAVYRKSLPRNHPYAGEALYMLGRALLENKRPSEAEAPLKEAAEIWAEQQGKQSNTYALVYSALAQVWALLGRAEAAEEAFKQSYPVLYRTQGAEGEATKRAQGWIEQLYARQNRSAEAAEYFASFDPDEERVPQEAP